MSSIGNWVAGSVSFCSNPGAEEVIQLGLPDRQGLLVLAGLCLHQHGFLLPEWLVLGLLCAILRKQFLHSPVVQGNINVSRLLAQFDVAEQLDLLVAALLSGTPFPSDMHPKHSTFRALEVPLMGVPELLLEGFHGVGPIGLVSVCCQCPGFAASLPSGSFPVGPAQPASFLGLMP